MPFEIGNTINHRPVIDRFWEKVQKTDGCWNWTGATHEFGYGVFGRAGGRGAGNHRAHRFSFRIHHGEIPDGMFVCHKCDNPLCVNPDHLFLGNAADNHADMRQKGRHAAPPIKHGSSNGNSVLTEELVLQMREMRACGATLKEVCDTFNTSWTNTARVLRRETWRHI